MWITPRPVTRRSGRRLSPLAAGFSPRGGLTPLLEQWGKPTRRSDAPSRRFQSAGRGFLTACPEAIKNLDLKDATAVERLDREANKLSKSSPDDLKGDWKTVQGYADRARQANGDAAKLSELSKNDGEKISQASEAIARQAKDTCKVSIAG